LVILVIVVIIAWTTASDYYSLAARELRSIIGGVAGGTIAIDLIDVVGDAVDFASGVVHRLARPVGLDGSGLGGLLRLSCGGLGASGGRLRFLGLRLRALDVGG
jgi:hypothetical protein